MYTYNVKWIYITGMIVKEYWNANKPYGRNSRSDEDYLYNAAICYFFLHWFLLKNRLYAAASSLDLYY